MCAPLLTKMQKTVPSPVAAEQSLSLFTPSRNGTKIISRLGLK
jgi:hypothetical protein